MIEALFSSDAGGYTANSRDVYGRNHDLPYCVAKPETYDLTKFKSTWTATMDLQEVARQLILAKLLPKGTVMSSISTTAKDVSGRVTEMSVLTTAGEQLKLSGIRFALTVKVKDRAIANSRLFNDLGRHWVWPRRWNESGWRTSVSRTEELDL